MDVMSESEPLSFPSVAAGVREARDRFLLLIEPHRPALFRYARGLTGDPWDAEDLVQDTLARAFENLGRCDGSVGNARAYLFRTATNLWVDGWRRRPAGPAGSGSAAGDVAEEGREPLGPEVREALERIAIALPPRERAVVLLGEVFGYTSREVATALGTNLEAAKAALHRGRAALRRGHTEAPAQRQAARRPPPELLDAFVAAFNARDIGRLLGLLDPGASVDIVGCHRDEGPEATRRVLRHTWEEDTLREAVVAEVAGEPCAVLLFAPAEGEAGDGDASGTGAPGAVGDLVRLWGSPRRLTRTRWYYFAPEVLAEAAAALGHPARPNGYRFTND